MDYARLALAVTPPCKHDINMPSWISLSPDGLHEVTDRMEQRDQPIAPKSEESTMALLSSLPTANRVSEPPSGWMAYFRIESVRGAFLHPSLAAIVRRVLRDHVPVIRKGVAELFVVCAVDVDDPSEAARKADELARLVRAEVTGLRVFGPELRDYRSFDEYFDSDAEVLLFPKSCQTDDK